MNSVCDTRTRTSWFANKCLPSQNRKCETSYDQYVPSLLQISSLIATDASNQQQLASSRENIPTIKHIKKENVNI